MVVPARSMASSRARVAAAQRAQVLAQQTLDAEQKKYNLGVSDLKRIDVVKVEV